MGNTKRNVIDHHYLETCHNFPIRLFTTQEVCYMSRIRAKTIYRYIKEKKVYPVISTDHSMYLWTILDIIDLCIAIYPKLAIPEYLRGAMNWSFLGAEPVQGMAYLKQFEQERDELAALYNKKFDEQREKNSAQKRELGRRNMIKANRTMEERRRKKYGLEGKDQLYQEDEEFDAPRGL